MPEWKDNAKKTEDQNAIRESLKNNNFTDDEINNIEDPRLLVLARKLARYEKAETETADIVKKVKKAPKVLRGKGGRFVKKVSKVDKALQNHQRANTRNSEVDAVKALLGY